MLPGLDAAQVDYWRQALADWKSSGESIQAYCRARGFSAGNYYTWRRRLAQRDGVQPTSVPPTSFVPLRVMAEAVLEVVLPTGVMVRVPTGADAAAVAKLVAALGNSSC
jgi:transposase